jgi:hypothetical protein
MDYSRIIRNEPIVLNELIKPRATSTITRASNICPAIQNILNGKVDIASLGVPSNFDAVSERASRREGPA